MVSQYPRSVGRDKKKFRETRELNNGTFIEVQRSAKEIQRFCFQVLEAIELSSEDLRVETVEKFDNHTPDYEHNDETTDFLHTSQNVASPTAALSIS